MKNKSVLAATWRNIPDNPTLSDPVRLDIVPATERMARNGWKRKPTANCHEAPPVASTAVEKLPEKTGKPDRACAIWSAGALYFPLGKHKAIPARATAHKEGNAAVEPGVTAGRDRQKFKRGIPMSAEEHSEVSDNTACLSKNAKSERQKDDTLRAELERVTETCRDTSSHLWDACQENNRLTAELRIWKKEFSKYNMGCISCGLYGEVRKDCPHCHGFNIESAVPLMESNEELFKRQDADLATLQAAYDTAAEENHHAYHAVIPGLKDELAAARERIAKLEDEISGDNDRIKKLAKVKEAAMEAILAWDEAILAWDGERDCHSGYMEQLEQARARLAALESTGSGKE